jgi:hypothetical protein
VPLTFRKVRYLFISHPRVTIQLGKSAEVLRVFSDFAYIICVVDIYTDCQHTDVVKRVVDLINHVLCNPFEERPEGEICLGQMTKE